MPLKKKSFSENEIVIFDDAVIYKRGDYWHFRIWLTKERKYARFSLKTRNQSTAIDRAKLYYHELMADQLNGKSYFSVTTRIGVERYLEQRWKDCEAGLIVKGRYSTIKTHLEHWLDFIHRDTKLKELERTDCENYFHERTKTKKGLSVSQSTILNEQSTINALMSWLYKNKETRIEAFDFKKLPRIDKGDESLRRSSFTDDEIAEIRKQLENFIAEKMKTVDEDTHIERRRRRPRWAYGMMRFRTGCTAAVPCASCAAAHPVCAAVPARCRSGKARAARCGAGRARRVRGRG